MKDKCYIVYPDGVPAYNKIYINLHLFGPQKILISCVNHLSFMGFRVSNFVRITDVSKRLFALAISFNKTVAFVQNFNLIS